MQMNETALANMRWRPCSHAIHCIPGITCEYAKRTCPGFKPEALKITCTYQAVHANTSSIRVGYTYVPSLHNRYAWTTSAKMLF